MRRYVRLTPKQLVAERKRQERENVRRRARERQEQRANLDGAERDKLWNDEKERIARLEASLAAIPESVAKRQFLQTMVERIWELYLDDCFEEGDILLEFLPRPLAEKLLWSFFDEWASDPPEATTGEDENCEWGQVETWPRRPFGADWAHAREENASEECGLSHRAE